MRDERSLNRPSEPCEHLPRGRNCSKFFRLPFWAFSLLFGLILASAGSQAWTILWCMYHANTTMVPRLPASHSERPCLCSAGALLTRAEGPAEPPQLFPKWKQLLLSVTSSRRNSEPAQLQNQPPLSMFDHSSHLRSILIIFR